MNKRVNRIKVHHETRYEYETDLSYAIQRIYLTPRQLRGVRTISWEIKSNFDCFSQIDSLGNELHLLVMSKPSKTPLLNGCSKYFLTSHNTYPFYLNVYA